MPPCTIEAVIEAFETEICGFGSKRIALREMRRLTGEPVIHELAQLRAYLMTLSTERFEPLLLGLRLRLRQMAFPTM